MRDVINAALNCKSGLLKNDLWRELDGFILCSGTIAAPLYLHSRDSLLVDLIDLQSQPDGEYKFIIVYQDHLTKFVILMSKRAEEVAFNLMDISSPLLGAPPILQSENGREFANNVVTSLKEF
ncbi:hypothetical protein AVEN_129268-1 [Araneus ventricosus]|uniref:Integrase catalytic domain-containing protein n=1 Tax=Araneus ventricosus TaxID=182803 RepID=A0A4Y2HMH6_ARAVE|nr:hypothetical protein AVEN_129268-1 [Araneus ventricosus]